MHNFKNDYGELAHPSIFQAMIDSNMVFDEGYGNDRHSENARRLIGKEIGRTDADIHFLPGGTPTNLIALCAFLRPHQAVVATEDSHIFTHETGSVEGTGHKILAVRTPDGRLTPEQIAPVLEAHQDEHMVMPALVKISNTTEIGTVYSKAELERLSAYCREENLLLYCDGARLGSALTSAGCGLSLADMAELTDAFYIGGTKNGALLGEALVITRETLKKDFRYIMKQRGGLLAKGRIIGIQFEELFRDGLFYRLAARANEMAARIREALEGRGYEFLGDSRSNQIFPIIDNDRIALLEKKFNFMVWKKTDEKRSVVRFVTSWATGEESVAALIDAL